MKPLLFAAVTLTALLCGASLDQSIKQLPARKVIGAQLFSAYAKAADLRNGVIWYAMLGLSAPLSCIVLAVLCFFGKGSPSCRLPIYFGALFAIMHGICTAFAAPLYHRQQKISETHALEKLFNRFESIQTARSICISLNLLSLLWGLWVFD